MLVSIAIDIFIDDVVIHFILGLPPTRYAIQCCGTKFMDIYDEEAGDINTSLTCKPREK